MPPVCCVRVAWRYGALAQVNGSNVLQSGGVGNGTSVNVTSNSTLALSAAAGFSAVAQDPLLLQGGRQYTFTIAVTADPPPVTPHAMHTMALPSGGYDYLPGSVAVTINYTLFSGVTSGVTYFPPVPPPCTSDVATDCQPEAVPNGGTSTRRRLLGFENVELKRTNNSQNASSVYYTCINPAFPCNRSLLTVQLNVPFTLADQPLITFQVRVQQLNVTVASPQVNSAALPFTSTSITPVASTGPAMAFSDPRFHGFWHQDFYVGGRAGAVYSLISDEAVQLNALFVQLERIRCPTKEDGHAVDRCFDHSGTFFGVLAFSTPRGDHVRITAGDVSTGFYNVTMNDLPLLPAFTGAVQPMQDLFSSASISVRMLSGRCLRVSVGLYEVDVDNVDLYMDVSKVEVRSWTELVDSIQPEGLIGRTWNASLAAPADEDEVDLYREMDDNILGHNTRRNRFRRDSSSPNHSALSA